jgi:sugar/nucleoside kinase (ribokinase family)
VAVGARRLGLRSGLVSWIGQDAAGADILSALRQAKIDTQGIHIDPHIPTSEATLLVFQGERTQLVHFEPREYLLPPLLPSLTPIQANLASTRSATIRPPRSPSTTA